jgi:hypothetical protein
MAHRTSGTILTMTFLLLSISPRTVSAQPPACDATSAWRQERDHLQSWQQIYDSFKRYSGCDDGILAEENSDAVVRMLADRWDQIPTLRTLVDRDQRFGKFVFMHIDSTTDDHDLDRVVANSLRHCPRGNEPLCDEIRRRAVVARSQIEPQNPHLPAAMRPAARAAP